MEYLLPALTAALNRLKEGRRWLILSDFDGTLSPIAEGPDAAFLPEETREALQRLARCPQTTVGIISGRALADLKNKVNLPGLIYAGNHGFEIEGPGLSFTNPVAGQIRPIFRNFGRLLNLALAPFRGVLVEDKGITLSVHFRQAEERSVEDIQRTVERSVRTSRFAPFLKITAGKKVLELRPAVAWDKGKAIRLLMKRYGKGGRKSGLVPVYLGDDLTDEDGFRVIAKYGAGLSVVVGEVPRESAAEYYLRSTHEIPFFFGSLAGVERGDCACPRYLIK